MKEDEMDKNILTRAVILQAQDIQTEPVDVPEWGGQVLVRGLSGAERDDFQQSVMLMHGKSVSLNLKNSTAKLVQLCCVDEQGKRLFSEDDVEALGEKSGIALDRVFGVAQRLSGLSQSDLESLTKNSVRGLNAASGSN